MLENKYQKKLLNAILYFSKNVKFPSQVKIFKLLFFLDFLHFKDTGRSVTNLEYYAWEFGPVPKNLWTKIKNKDLPEDFQKAINLESISTGKGNESTLIKSKIEADMKVFTPREKKILENLIFIFKDAKPSEMSEITHLKNSPWDKTRKEEGENKLISYLRAIDEDAKISLEEAEEALKEIQEMKENYKLDGI